MYYTQYSAVLYHVLHTVQYSTIPCITHSTVQYYTMYYTQYSTVLDHVLL